MIIVFIICAILYLIMIYSVLYLYYAYKKDIEEIENRLLQLEKRINECETISSEYKDVLEILFENLEVLNIDTYKKLKEYSKIKDKESEKTMACKGKRKK